MGPPCARRVARPWGSPARCGRSTPLARSRRSLSSPRDRCVSEPWGHPVARLNPPRLLKKFACRPKRSGIALTTRITGKTRDDDQRPTAEPGARAAREPPDDPGAAGAEGARRAPNHPQCRERHELPDGHEAQDPARAWPALRGQGLRVPRRPPRRPHAGRLDPPRDALRHARYFARLRLAARDGAPEIASHRPSPGTMLARYGASPGTLTAF